MEFETHVTTLYSVHLQDLDGTTHTAVSEEDDGLRVVISPELALMPEDVA